MARRISRSNVGEFHVADSANDQVYRVPSGGGNPIMDLVQGGVITVADNQTDGKPYIWDTQTCQIQTVNASNALIHFSGAATCGLADGNATTGQFTAVPDLVFDGAGILWVADQFRIRRVAADGSITTLAGSTQGHTDATGAAAQFQSPLGITLDDAAHVLYVTDGTTIRVVTMGGAVTTLVGSTAGFVDGDGCVAPSSVRSRGSPISPARSTPSTSSASARSCCRRVTACASLRCRRLPSATPTSPAPARAA